MLSRIPLDFDTALDTFVSVVTESFLLNMKMLGFIPLCFFTSLSPLLIRCFKLVPPVVMLMLVVFVAKCAPQLFQRLFRKLPTEGICFLVLVSFWSLATTCIEIITPVYLSGIDEARVYFSPDLVYFHAGQHIALCIIAIAILIILGCVIVVLSVSPFIPTFHHLKPLLDEFQSCYMDNCRWYGGVYLISWIILEVLSIIRSHDYLIFQTVLAILTVVHFSVQPYCRKWLNITDGFLLVSLNFTTSLTLGSDLITERVVLVYLSILIPLTYIVLGVIAILLDRCGMLSKMRKLTLAQLKVWKKRHQIHTIQDPGTIPYMKQRVEPLDRDSLIGILQEEEYGTFGN